MQKGYLKSKDIGDYAENRVGEIFSSIGKVSKNDNVDYDLLVTYDKKFTIEIKYDFYSEKSGNIAIEYLNTKKNKPSGIYASKADFWVYYLGPELIYLIKKESLLKFVKEEKPHRKVHGGDNNSAMFLYKKEHILPRFINIFGLDRECLVRLIEEGLC